jgi:transposase
MKSGPKIDLQPAGLAPYTQASGEWRGKASVAGGRASVRTTLHMAAVTAAMHNPALKASYKRIVAAAHLTRFIRQAA